MNRTIQCESLAIKKNSYGALNDLGQIKAHQPGEYIVGQILEDAYYDAETGYYFVNILPWPLNRNYISGENRND